MAHAQAARVLGLLAIGRKVEFYCLIANELCDAALIQSKLNAIRTIIWSSWPAPRAVLQQPAVWVVGLNDLTDQVVPFTDSKHPKRYHY